LILKLIAVPLAVLLLGITERVHGPRAAGWLSGFPVIAAPLLLFIAIDQGPAFASTAALAAFFGLVPWLSFCMVYAWCTQFWSWPWCAAAGFLAWLAVAVTVIALQGLSPLFEALPPAIAIAAIWFHIDIKPSQEQREHPWWRLALRMLTGAGLTVIITQLAAKMGPHWSGTFTTFPVVGSIIAISNHVEHGRRAVQEAVAGMVLGLISVQLFCFAVFKLVVMTSVWTTFAIALVLAMAVQALSWHLLRLVR
jgi:hypothetical protein